MPRRWNEVEEGDLFRHGEQMELFPPQGRTAPIRTFETGATRNTDEGRFDYEGFLSPTVLTRYAEYMHKHRLQADGSLRASDNWQKGIPKDQYMKSMFRHFIELWTAHRTGGHKDEALCALMFNVMGYLHEELKFAEEENEQVG